ncbi:MAG: DNA-protecting protein DprA [Rhodospirillales bacterium]|nr:DNA-protecting protein DprA [Rhodospirillales bacterium]
MSDRAMPSLSETERLDRLRLIRSENVGPITFRRLIERYGSAGEALAALPDLARRGGRRGSVRICPPARAQAEMESLRACGARLIICGDADYPPLLAAIDDAPASVALIGDAGLLTAAAMAVVGSRNASLNGRHTAAELARDLGAAGFVVVSGLARGIDGEAHRAALPYGTIAVLAGGVDVCYPQEHQDLYARIKESGAIIAEAPPGMAPQARHFPRRNRLISGLARGVVVVEANLRSGSLITARMAGEQGREVFAVPGSPRDPRARGCNELIRHGATLTESIADILAVLPAPAAPRIPRPAAMASDASRPPIAVAPASTPPPAHAKSPLRTGIDADPPDAARRAVAETLSPTPVAVDEIIRTCQLSPGLISTILLEWELAGRLERHPGNRVSLIT